MTTEQLTILSQTRGFTVVNDTTQTSPPDGYMWTGFLVRAAATFTKLEAIDLDPADAAKFIALACPAGTYIPGRFTTVTLSAGNIVLFKALKQ